MLKNRSFALAIVSVLTSAHFALAERMPDKPEDATHVVTGTVQRVFSRETKDQFQYIVEIKVDHVERPDSLTPSKLLSVYCFRAKRIERVLRATTLEKFEAALASVTESGHSAIPREGQRIRALAKTRNGRLEGLYPVWFSLVEEEPDLGYKESVKPRQRETTDDSSEHQASRSRNELPEFTEEESEKYYFDLMQRAKGFRVQKEDAATYLRGVWRLDRRAHISGGHYTHADLGDDVSLVCTDKVLIQVDFNRNKPESHEYAVKLKDLHQDEQGRIHFDNHRLFVPMSKDHLAVGQYDYVVILRRVSGRD